MSIDNDFQRLLDGANKKEKEMSGDCCSNKSKINGLVSLLKFWERPIKDEKKFIDDKIALLKGQLDMLKQRKKELTKRKGK